MSFEQGKSVRSSREAGGVPGERADSIAGSGTRTVSRIPLRIERPRKAVGASDQEILRFRKSERMLHWAIAVPFMVCWASALVLVLVYNPDPLRPFRDVFSWLHRISGVCLVLLPMLAMLKNRKDYRIHIYNIKCAVLWSLNDLKWVALMGLAAVSKRIRLPEQGKFNAAEKVNFMSVMFATPILALTGILIWTHEYGWAAWLVHGLLALAVSPTMLGHIYMATVNRDTRTGLSGMTTGYVDRHWAKHHYAVWYRQQFGEDGCPEQVQPEPRRVESARTDAAPDRRIQVQCPACARNLSVSWHWLLQKILSVSELPCPNCGATFAAISLVTDEQQLEWIKLQFERKKAGP